MRTQTSLVLNSKFTDRHVYLVAGGGFLAGCLLTSLAFWLLPAGNDTVAGVQPTVLSQANSGFLVKHVNMANPSKATSNAAGNHLDSYRHRDESPHDQAQIAVRAQPSADMSHHLSPHDASPSPDANSLDLLLQRVQEPEQPVMDPFSQLTDLLNNDLVARERAIEAYLAETDPQRRDRLHSVLMFVDAQEVTDLGLQLASADDAVRRAEGYALLSNAQQEPGDALSTLIDGIKYEQNDIALAAAVNALMPNETPSRQEAARVVPELRRLTREASSAVRGDAVLALSRWDHSPQTEGVVYSALNSNDTHIRDAALTALVENPMQTDRIRDSLVGIATDDSADPELRWRALDVVGRYDITDQDRQALEQVRQVLPVPMGR
jgi:hypothetical protein